MGTPAVEDELVAIGSVAVEETLARAVERGPEDDTFTPLLQKFGPGALVELFAAYRRRKEDWLSRFGEFVGRTSSSTVVGRVVQSFGREALPHFEPLLDSADRDLRKIIIDFYVGLADQQEFRKVLERFPPVEVVRRLDQTPPQTLQRFLASVEAESFQADVLLLEPTFSRDTDVFDAIPESAAEGVLESVLARRGFSQRLFPKLLESLPDARLGAVAGRLLDAYAPRSHELEVAAFADLDLDSEIRECLRARLTTIGAPIVGELCDCFGAAPASLDAEVVAVLAAMGTCAVVPLVECYGHGGLLEKLAGPLVKRHTHRRTMIIRALGDVGDEAARAALAKLRASETDPNLKLRLDQAQHRIESERRAAPDSREDGHGQTG